MINNYDTGEVSDVSPRYNQEHYNMYAFNSLNKCNIASLLDVYDELTPLVNCYDKDKFRQYVEFKQSEIKNKIKELIIQIYLKMFSNLSEEEQIRIKGCIDSKLDKLIDELIEHKKDHSTIKTEKINDYMISFLNENNDECFGSIDLRASIDILLSRIESDIKKYYLIEFYINDYTSYNKFNTSKSEYNIIYSGITRSREYSPKWGVLSSSTTHYKLNMLRPYAAKQLNYEYNPFFARYQEDMYFNHFFCEKNINKTSYYHSFRSNKYFIKYAH